MLAGAEGAGQSPRAVSLPKNILLTAETWVLPS